MIEKIKKKQQTILNILSKVDLPLSSSKIADELEMLGYDMSQRTVRFYLVKMDQAGFTENIKKRGRKITELGLNELGASSTIDRVGFLSSKIDQMTYGMNFDFKTKSGTVVINLSIVEPYKLLECLDVMSRVFEYGFAMGHLMTLLGPGERFGHETIPENRIGIGTVCSITVNGVLLKYGIPANSRFGGLLELKGGKPVRFVEIINYDGTSIDPLEVFIKSGMTNCTGVVRSGNGRIGASFREFPAESRGRVEDLSHRLEDVGLGGVMKVGRPNQSLLEIPVSEGRVGAIVIGGLNPVAILEEIGVRVHSRALGGLIDFNKLFHYTELKTRLEAFL